MKISESTLYCLPMEGRCTLQIPQYEIVFERDMAIRQPITEEKTIDLPDDYFCKRKSWRLSVGKESGFLQWSERGYRAMHDQILAHFDPSQRGKAWDEEFIETELRHVREDTRKYIKKLRRDADAAEKLLSETTIKK